METNSICYLGTQEYEENVRRLKVQPDEALKILAQHIRGARHNVDPSIKSAIGNHVILVGNAYHFHLPRGTGEIPLAGYYVDGFTGKVELRRAEGSVPSPPGKADAAAKKRSRYVHRQFTK